MFMDAFERADADRLTALLREDARQSMPPALMWFDGREAIAALYHQLLGPDAFGDFRLVATAANRQPAAAAYLRAKGKNEFRLTGLNVLRVEHGQIAEIVSYRPDLCAAGAQVTESRYEVRRVVIPPGRKRPYERREWLGALVVVESGAVELESLHGVRCRFVESDTLALDGLRLRALHNQGQVTALLAATVRKNDR